MAIKVSIPYAFRELTIPSRYKAYYSGRSTAKSHSMAQELVLRGARQPLRVLCAREIQKSIKESVKRLLEDKIKLAGLSNFYNSTNYSISSPINGTEFLFTGLRTNPKNLKSFEGVDICWLEEADAVSQSSLDIIIPTIRPAYAGHKPELWFSWNRRYTTDPVDNMFLGPGGPPPNSIVRRVHHTDNPWFPEVLRDEMEWLKKRDYEKYLNIWEGEPVSRSAANVFTNWKIDDIDDQIPDGCIPRLGADWGFSVDPTVLIEAYVWDRILYLRREAYKVKCEIDEIPSLFAGDDLKSPVRWLNKNAHTGISAAKQGYPIVADSARPETISYLKKRGFNIVSARKGPGSIKEGLEFMNSFDIVVHPDCKHIIDELVHYKYKVDPETERVLPELVDSHNHTIDSCRYALEGIRKAQRTKGFSAPSLIKLTA
jgi:phage terminase large subunit